MNTKEGVILFGYKIFILSIIAIQIYAIIFQIVNSLTLIGNVSLIVYLIFRFYLLLKLPKDGIKTIPFSRTRCEVCGKQCESCN